MTTYFYIDRELSEINYYEERNAYYQQAREKYNKGEEVTFLPIGEKAIPDLLYILNDNREDSRFNAFFVRNTIMETFKSGNMQAASNLIVYLGQDNPSRSSYQNPHREMIESVVDEQLRKAPEWLSKLEPKAKFTLADIYAENTAGFLYFINKMLNFKYRTKTERVMQDDTLVVLAEYNTVTEAEIAKSMLDSAGIWSTIRNEYMSAIYPIGTMPAQVVVRADELEKARTLLQHR